jgi:hypothetical protein
MNQQLREGEGDTKRQKETLKTSPLDRKLPDDSVVGDEVEPADLFDPEEFGVGRLDSKIFRP